MPGAAEPTHSFELSQLGGAPCRRRGPVTALTRVGEVDQAEATAADPGRRSNSDRGPAPSGDIGNDATGQRAGFG
jgi:hypothetical protein